MYYLIRVTNNMESTSYPSTPQSSARRNSRMSRTPNSSRTPTTPGSSTRRPNTRNNRNSNRNNRTRKMVNRFSTDMLLEKTIPESCDWWPFFVTKLVNLINLLERQTEFDYVLAGSSANALLAYFYRTESLADLPAPNDGDILIVAKERPVGKRKINFKDINLHKIGNYKLDDKQKEEESGTFVTSKPTDDTFTSIDVNIEAMVKYISINGFKILNPDVLLDRYKEFGRPANSVKKSVLAKVIPEYKDALEKGKIEIETYRMPSDRNNSRGYSSRFNNTGFSRGALF